MNTALDAPEAPEAQPVGRWRSVLRRRWVLWAGIGLLGATLVTAAVAVPLAVAAAERAAAVDTWKTSLTEAFAASDTYVAAVAAHTEQVAAGTAEVTAINAILDALPAELVDPTTTRDDVAAVAAALQAAASVETLDPGVTSLPNVPAPASAGDLAAVDEATAGSSATQMLDAAAGFRAQAADIDGQRTTLNETTDAIAAARENARAPLAALIAAAIAKAPTFPIDRAGERERAAFITALDALRPAAVVADATAVDVPPLVKAYVDALSAARASHDAVVAAEQEAQRQAQEDTDSGSTNHSSSSTGGGGGRGTSGGSSSNNGGGGSSGGGSSGGGGSDSSTGGGGSGSGGSTGGGGGGTSGSAWQPLKIASSSADCYSSNVNGQEATYGSTLLVPHDAAGYRTYEISGYGWGVSWECF